MADDSEQVGQDEIEQLLRQAQGGGASPAPPVASAPPAADTSTVDQAEIEALLSGGSTTSVKAAAPSSSNRQTAGNNAVSQNDIELLLNKAEAALASIDSAAPAAAAALPAGMRTFEFEKFRGTAANSEVATLELVRDVQLDMTIELGRTHMHLEDVLQLRKGAVVPLDKLAGDPADIYVNGRLIARGEILVLNDNFCIRVAELIVGEAA